jgi:hypothetical protein
MSKGKKKHSTNSTIFVSLDVQTERLQMFFEHEKKSKAKKTQEEDD